MDYWGLIKLLGHAGFAVAIIWVVWKAVAVMIDDDGCDDCGRMYEETEFERMERIARVAHEVNRGYCAAIGDDTALGWDEAPDWQVDAAIAGVAAALDRNMTPEEMHRLWSEKKLADGWRYGETKDAEAKTHPCLVPYELLPQEQRIKDYLFMSVVRAMA